MATDLKLRTASSFSSNKTSRTVFGVCLHLTPWSAIATSTLFLVGLTMYIAGSSQVAAYSIQIADAIGVAPALTSKIKYGLLSATLAISIYGSFIVGLVLLLALWRMAQRTMLFGECCFQHDQPEPWIFTVYRAFGGVLNLLVWALLLCVVATLMVLLVWLGASVAITAAITQGRNEADAVLGPLGLDLDSASDASEAAMRYISPLINSPSVAAALLGSSAVADAAPFAFQPLCPPVCLNLGSFAIFFGTSQSCVCGSRTLQAVGDAARRGTRVSVVALAGAFAMYVAATSLLMILSGHFVDARHDRSAAKRMQAAASERLESGYFGDSDSSCLKAPLEISPSALLAPPPPAPPLLLALLPPRPRRVAVPVVPPPPSPARRPSPRSPPLQRPEPMGVAPAPRSRSAPPPPSPLPPPAVVMAPPASPPPPPSPPAALAAALAAEAAAEAVAEASAAVAAAEAASAAAEAAAEAAAIEAAAAVEVAAAQPALQPGSAEEEAAYAAADLAAYSCSGCGDDGAYTSAGRAAGSAEEQRQAAYAYAKERALAGEGNAYAAAVLTARGAVPVGGSWDEPAGAAEAPMGGAMPARMSSVRRLSSESAMTIGGMQR